MILMESLFICPVCSQKMFDLPNALRCINGHSFDKAKQGYVNLLMSNSSNKRHGDDKLMVNARRNFLNNGYYAPLRQEISKMLGKDNLVLDVGCGEGYYTHLFAQNNRVCGIDISKDAIKLGAKHCREAEFAVASVASIPLADSSVDAVVSIFAPENTDEFLRVLKPQGRWLTVMPMEKHLIELKQAVYEKAYLNPEVNPYRKGFTLKSQQELKYGIALENNEDIVSLFKMTPYYYKTSKTDQQKLENLNTLSTTLEFFIVEYVKTNS